MKTRIPREKNVGGWMGKSYSRNLSRCYCQALLKCPLKQTSDRNLFCIIKRDFDQLLK